MPNPQARESLWRSDGAFVAAIERQLPKNAMVFQLPVVDFPEHSAIERLSADDLIKEGYLHSKTLRWSAGGDPGTRRRVAVAGVAAPDRATSCAA